MFQRVVRSVGWIIALRIMQLSLSLVRVTVLAYILVPYDFGLIGLSFLTTAVLEAFSQSGFYPALIQKQENIRPFLDTAWTVLLLRGFALFIFIYLVAPYVAIFFNIPALKIIIQITGISFIIQGFHNVGVVYFQKDLQFHKQLIYQFSGAIIDCIVAIVFAFMFRNVWAIIIGFLAGDFVRLLVSYSLHPFRPHFELNFKKAGELFKFGKWVLGSSALGFFINRGDEAFAGKLFGATTLGFYQIGHKISDAPATELTHTIFQVTLPAYSKLQDNIQKLQEAYLKVFQLIAFFSFLIAGLIIILIPDFIKIFLGDK